MKLQLAILAFVFLLFGVVAYIFIIPHPTGKFTEVVNQTTTTLQKSEGYEYDFTEAHVNLSLMVTDHLIVGKKTASELDFGGLPIGSLATGKIRVEVSGKAPVYCNISGNISRLANPKEFLIKETTVVEFNLTIENVSIGEIYTGSFDCYKPR